MKVKEICLLVTALLSFGAMAQQSPPMMGGARGPGGAIPSEVKPPAPPSKEALSAAAGAYYAYVMTNGLATQLGIDAKSGLDIAKVFQAFSNTVEGAAGAITTEDALKVLREQSAYLNVFKQEAIKKMTEEGPQFKAAGEKFMANMGTSPGVTRLPNGVLYKAVKEGDGEMPSAQDIATVSFKMTLIDGTEVATTEHRPISLAPNSIPPGLSEALQLMKVGAHWIVYLPYTEAFKDKPEVPDAKLGYKVPPYSAVIFDVELEGVKRQPGPPPTMGQPPGPTMMPPTGGTRSAGPPPPTSSEIVRVPSAEEMQKGEKPHVMTPAEVEAEKAKALTNMPPTNGTAPK